MKSMVDQRDKNMKIIQQRMKLSEKEIKRFNPVSPLFFILLWLLQFPFLFSYFIDIDEFDRTDHAPY